MKMILPIVFLIAGLVAGVAAGVFLTPAGAPEEHDSSDSPDGKKGDTQTDTKVNDKSSKAHGAGKDEKDGAFEYLKMTKQFVVPVVRSDEIEALVTLSLSLETRPGLSEEFFEVEPKLRDAFLQVLFDHANMGGFDGEFTRSDNLGVLRRSLLEAAKKNLGEDVNRVLIMSVSRQDT